MTNWASKCPVILSLTDSMLLSNFIPTDNSCIRIKLFSLYAWCWPFCFDSKL